MSEKSPVILAEDGSPFPSEQSARAALKERELDARQYVAIKYRGGWAIVDAARMAESLMSKPEPAAKPARKFYWVEFNHRGGSNDLPYVPLCVEGFQLRCQRGVPVCIPDFMLEAAKCAVHENWQPDPTGKVAVMSEGKIQVYPHRVLREGTEAEYAQQLASGNALTNQHIEMMRRKSP